MIAIVFAQSKLGTQPFKKLREYKSTESAKLTINNINETQSKPETVQKPKRNRRTGMGSNWFGK